MGFLTAPLYTGATQGGGSIDGGSKETHEL